MSQQKLYWMIRLMVLVLVLMSVIGIGRQTAAAQPVVGNGWATWSVEVDFPDEQIQAQLLVTVGHYDIEKRQHVIDDVQAKELECMEQGAVTIENGVATFPGDAYFTCVMPDIAEMAANMTNGRLLIGSHCNCKDPWIAASLTPEPFPVQPEPLNPIFYRDDLQLSTPIQSGSEKARLEFTVDMATATSETFVLDQPIYDVWASFEPLPNYLNTFQPFFELNQVNLTAFPSLINQQLLLSTRESVIYIGYNPQAGAYYEGELQELDVDPACFGVG